MSFELSFLNFLQSLHSPFLNQIMIFFTNLGNQGFIWVCLTLILLIIPKTRKIGGVLLIALIIDTFVCNICLKNIFMRPRPCTLNPTIKLLISKPTDYSFPSGHTAASFTIVSALYLLNQKKLFAISLVLACLISFSRMYLYVHYPSDILGGILVGIICGITGYYLFQVLFSFVKDKDLLSR